MATATAASRLTAPPVPAHDPVATGELVRANNSYGEIAIRPEPVPRGQVNVPLQEHATNGCDTCRLHLDRVDVANSGGMCLCDNVLIEYKWLHDNYIANLADPSQAHTGGVFPAGGDGPVEIGNSRLEPGIDATTAAPVPGYWQAITAVLSTQGGNLRSYHVHERCLLGGAYVVRFEDGWRLRVNGNLMGLGHFALAFRGINATVAEWSGTPWRA